MVGRRVGWVGSNRYSGASVSRLSLNMTVSLTLILATAVVTLTSVLGICWKACSSATVILKIPVSCCPVTVGCWIELTADSGDSAVCAVLYRSACSGAAPMSQQSASQAPLQRITVLGSTGSIGTSTLDVISAVIPTAMPLMP